MAVELNAFPTFLTIYYFFRFFSVIELFQFNVIIPIAVFQLFVKRNEAKPSIFLFNLLVFWII